MVKSAQWWKIWWWNIFGGEKFGGEQFGGEKFRLWNMFGGENFRWWNMFGGENFWWWNQLGGERFGSEMRHAVMVTWCIDPNLNFFKSSFPAKKLSFSAFFLEIYVLRHWLFSVIYISSYQLLPRGYLLKLEHDFDLDWGVISLQVVFFGLLEAHFGQK